jgi:hypothetical protein
VSISFTTTMCSGKVSISCTTTMCSGKGSIAYTTIMCSGKGSIAYTTIMCSGKGSISYTTTMCWGTISIFIPLPCAQVRLPSLDHFIPVALPCTPAGLTSATNDQWRIQNTIYEWRLNLERCK